MFEFREIEYDRILQYEVMSSAVECANAKDRLLIESDASERNLCSRIATYIERILQEYEIAHYKADTEYNRGMNGHNGNIKRLEEKPITLDISVHQREYDEVFGYRNLLCVEMKKSNNPEGCSSDIERLKKLTDGIHGFGYKMGFMLWVDQAECRIEIKNVFVNGEEWGMEHSIPEK